MTDELETDDEVTRIQAMTDGPKRVSKLTLRPITGESWAWMQTVKIFDDGIGTYHQAAAFAFLHSEPVDELRRLVFNRDLFWPEVSKWIGERHAHHDEIEPYAQELTAAYERYAVATTTAANPNDANPSGIKN
jgi:hypothetical protein